MDTDLKYLLVTVAILVVVAGWHNAAIDEEDAVDFGYCNTDITCMGFSSGDMCIGIEKRDTNCVDYRNAEEYRRVEVECAIQAYNLCQEDYNGKEWASNATYEGTTCRQWKQEDDRVTLIGCDQSFPPAHTWKNIE